MNSQRWTTEGGSRHCAVITRSMKCSLLSFSLHSAGSNLINGGGHNAREIARSKRI